MGYTIVLKYMYKKVIVYTIITIAYFNIEFNLLTIYNIILTYSNSTEQRQIDILIY